MKVFVTEKIIAHKKWEIEIHTDRYGNKFVLAKRETIYGSLLEVRIVEHDGFYIPKEKNNQVLDMEELFEVKNKMMQVLKKNIEMERGEDYGFNQRRTQGSSQQHYDYNGKQSYANGWLR